LKLELNDQERRAVGKSLVERKAHLIENSEDTTHTRATQRAGLLELSATHPPSENCAQKRDATIDLTEIDRSHRAVRSADHEPRS
jgi:hypothetical protein